MSDTSEYQFEVTGGYNVQNNMELVEAFDGSVVGFKLPDGRIARPCVALEVEPADGNPHKYEYITSEKEMEKIGFEGLDYSNIQFFAIVS